MVSWEYLQSKKMPPNPVSVVIKIGKQIGRKCPTNQCDVFSKTEFIGESTAKRLCSTSELTGARADVSAETRHRTFPRPVE